jgi:hypothetical protein
MGASVGNWHGKERKNMTEHPEFDPLVSRYLDGSITAGDLVELESKILADEQFALHFSRGCLLHRQIAELLNESNLHQIMEQFATGTPLPKAVLDQMAAARGQRGASPTAGSGQATEHRPIIRFSRSTWPRLFWLGGAAAAVFVVLTLFHGNSSPQRGEPANSEAPPQRGEAPDVVATVTQVVEGVWQPNAAVLKPGEFLAKGSRVALKSGMVKVTFECGAEVVLQGPCDFELQTPMVGFLKSGKITANVPRRAFSFAIHSPEVDFVDLGTAFGVTIGSSGNTELHVFEGEVLCSPSKQENDDRKEPIHVMAANALEFGANGGAPSNIAIDTGQFSSLINLRQRAGGRSLKTVPEHLALWLTADQGISTDSQQRVVWWKDILYGDNRSAEDATQNDEHARPILVPSALNGHPAVRFNGQSDYLVTTPLETTDDQTVLFVCQFSPTAYDKHRQWGGQILNYDGPPSRYLSNTLEPGVLQIGEPLLAEEFKPTLLTGQVFAGFVGSALVESGRVDAVQVGADVPVVAAYVYDYGGGRANLSINGRSYGEARAFAPQAITSRKIIGRHAWKQLFFQGDLAEMLIYNHAMTPAELAHSIAYLADKYSITIDPQASTGVEVRK